MLDKEKELASQREREAAEACEKERQANVRLQLAETLLKKKTEEHRQLVHECQLKENQVIFELFSIQSITDPGETIKRKKKIQFLLFTAVGAHNPAAWPGKSSITSTIAQILAYQTDFW